MIHYVPVHRAMAGVQPWLRKHLGPDPIFKGQPREAFWLPDGRVIPDGDVALDDLPAAVRAFAFPVRAAVLEFDD